MAKTSKLKTSTGILIGVAIFLSLVLMSMICKDTEWFANLKEKVGYPRPQGNLPNFKYGTKPKVQKKERRQWNSVLKRNPNIKEGFKVPQSKTILV